ncbi:telomere-binding alpha subunit central domain-containing protein [Colletotrichum salicis]|uniref:Protection of telomeres protein 1 n=1 Tax=Colletotrichum salicis TaxID=1209931 RepID=A0A135U3U4_9PEZI|nr:telomere-binding alpha subunit central domain-containing protein [Colletotrichum salicis]
MAETEDKKVMDLPKGFTSLSDVLDEKVQPQSSVNVIGLVKDFRRPTPTKKKDYICQIRLVDLSLSNESLGRDVNLAIFRLLDGMPNIKSSDVIVAHQVRVNRYQSDPLSLLANFSTTLHIYPATTIPHPLQQTPAPSKPSATDKKRIPAPVEGEYVSWLFHNINKTDIPELEAFEIQANQSLNIKQKLCELKGVRDGKFHDLIVRVVRDPYDSGDKVTLYVSDYTENSGFFHYTNKHLDAGGGRDGDPYGYTHGKTRKSDSSLQWEGPFGKQTMQITCWHPHATVIRERIKKDDWVRLSNVQIKYGSNGHNLEGFLREDRNAFKNKICVDKLDAPTEGESMDPYVKNALRRKRDYEKQLKTESKETKPTKGAGNKRQAADQPEEKRLNTKQQRALRRSKAAEKEKEAEKGVGEDKEVETPPDLNSQVVCENHDEPAVDVAAILQPATQEFIFQNAPLTVKLPFHNAQYRTNVRVVDFHPSRIQDFACIRKQSEYDALSDFSGTDSEDDDDDDEEGHVTIDKYVSTSEHSWEWRFALCLQDATAAKGPKTQGKKTNRFWVVVDNMDAQLLTNLDACDFRTNPDILTQLREKMFILWGDLEEKKTQKLAEQGKKQKANVGKKKKTNDRPPDSDDEDAGAGAAPKMEKEAISNRPFTCCIRQYGIRVKESDTEKADAGPGKKWQRMYGLFGTKICG